MSKENYEKWPSHTCEWTLFALGSSTCRASISFRAEYRTANICALWKKELSSQQSLPSSACNAISVADLLPQRAHQMSLGLVHILLACFWPNLTLDKPIFIKKKMHCNSCFTGNRERILKENRAHITHKKSRYIFIIGTVDSHIYL